MKNAKGLLTVTLIVLVTLVNAMGSNEYLDLRITGKKTFQVSVKNVVGDTKISISDLAGITLHASQISNLTSFKREFDVSSLPSGSYILAIADEYKTQKVALKISEQIELDLSNVETKLNPIITANGENVSVSIYAHENEKLRVSIYDAAQNRIENAVIQGTGFIGRKFNLESLETGKYSVVVNHEGRSFSKEVEL